MPVIALKHHSLVENSHLAGKSRVYGYLVFSNGGDHWWSKYLKKGYKHVYFIKYTGIFWIKLDYTLDFMDYGLLPYDQYDTIETVLKGQDVSYLRVDTYRQVRRYRSVFISPHTCVEAMKAVLGISSFWVLTPYQLFKYMR